MTNVRLEKMKTMKEKFRALPAKERELVSVCFLKVKLGVHADKELKTVQNFLAGFTQNVSPENLDSIITYLHSTTDKLPEFIIMEDSISEMDTLNDSKNFEKPVLPDYKSEDLETIRESIPPFKE